MDTSVSGVVVNYRTKELTKSAVESILCEPEVADVVVVDNASGDGSAELLRQDLVDPRVKVVASDTNRGFGQGVNLGVANATETSEFLLFLNSDAVVEPGALGPLVQALRSDQQIAIAAPLIVAPSGETQIDSHGVFPSLRTMVFRTNRHPPDDLQPDWVSGAAMLVRRAAFDQVGGFDPAFHMYLEDVDLCKRLREQAWNIRRVAESRVRHQSGGSGKTAEQTDMYHRSLVTLMRKQGAPKLEVTLVSAAHRAWSTARSTITPPRSAKDIVRQS
ncbi:MAG: glycosyltransferase family 2 protein [Acidimicrobiales bacterium]|jgi:N-acetylglucosaminyl-diphospho-decaprenol L-rhamnosyltransferase